MVGKPHGISGDVYVERLTDHPDRFAPGSELLHSDGRALVVERARKHRSRFLVKFQGIDDRDQAETLRGELSIPADRGFPLDEDEYRPAQLVGCTVTIAPGDVVGEVTDVQLGSVQDLLVVATPAGDRLVPLVKALVTEVDLQSRRIVIDPPEGLFD